MFWRFHCFFVVHNSVYFCHSFFNDIYMLRVASKMGVSLLWQHATVHCIWRINISLSPSSPFPLSLSRLLMAQTRASCDFPCRLEDGQNFQWFFLVHILLEGYKFSILKDGRINLTGFLIFSQFKDRQPSVLWHCRLGVRKIIRPVKIEWWGAGVVICLKQGANYLHMVQLMPLLPRHLLLHQNQ